ncbi:hypothetical protein AST13_02160 [Staphylococcus xylosus]|uniref:hypothetical protein n=1 Tax=Staphylococcus xylosus TaxID=1288 RepID=UPI000852DE9B|nr:hypothetical protein [Staphylococcus xylosus]OEL06864.1 hypothetical protein AST13_02160 [Staphylococcus xylosus]
MTEDNNKQYNPKDPGHRGGGGPGHEKRSNEPARKSYNNRTTEFERPSESTMESLFGNDYKKKG